MVVIPATPAALDLVKKFRRLKEIRRLAVFLIMIRLYSVCETGSVDLEAIDRFLVVHQHVGQGSISIFRRPEVG